MGDTKQTVKEVIAGILFIGVIGEILVLVIMGVNVPAILGLFLGIVMSVGMFIHMKRTIEDSVDMIDEKAVKAHMIKTYLIRTAAVVIVFLAAFFSGVFDMLFVLLGLFALKLGVYLRPLMHRIFQNVF